MKVESVRIKSTACSFGVMNNVLPRTQMSCYDKMFTEKSPKLSSVQKEFLFLPDSVIEWANRTGQTPEGTYVLIKPKSYYNSKTGSYEDTYTLINENERRHFLYAPKKQYKELIWTRDIPKGYKIKRVLGRAKIVSPTNERIVNQESFRHFVTNFLIGFGSIILSGFVIYRVGAWVKSV